MFIQLLFAVTLLSWPISKGNPGKEGDISRILILKITCLAFWLSTYYSNDLIVFAVDDFIHFCTDRWFVVCYKGAVTASWA